MINADTKIEVRNIADDDAVMTIDSDELYQLKAKHPEAKTVYVAATDTLTVLIASEPTVWLSRFVVDGPDFTFTLWGRSESSAWSKLNEAGFSSRSVAVTKLDEGSITASEYASGCFDFIPYGTDDLDQHPIDPQAFIDEPLRPFNNPAAYEAADYQQQAIIVKEKMKLYRSTLIHDGMDDHGRPSTHVEIVEYENDWQQFADMIAEAAADQSFDIIEN